MKAERADATQDVIKVSRRSEKVQWEEIIIEGAGKRADVGSMGRRSYTRHWS